MYHFIVNPVSRSGKGLILWQKKIEPILKKKNIPYRVEYTKQRGDTTELCRKISASAKNEDNCIIVALGGDGTVNDAVQGIEDFENTTFALIPTGSGNDFAKDMKISKNVKKTLKKILSAKKYAEALKKFKDQPATTEDGTLFKIYANIGTPEEAAVALEHGADGIGLFRTEFLFMNALQEFKRETGAFSNSLSEEAQFEAYKKVLQIMGDKPVTIRTLDAGGDKLIDSGDMPLFEEKNPLMGLRAIRLSLYYSPQIFRTQLRALYRASVYGNLRILLPLITDVTQVETDLGIARGVQLSLKEDNIPFNPDVPIGIMIETAAAAVCSDCLAPHSKFFSLGTNDLTQYTLCVDRENTTVAPLYNEFNLAVLRLIKTTIANAEEHNVPVSVCGEMAGNKESVIILAGMGIRNLSMAPKKIPVIKEMLSRFSISELKNLSNRSLF